MERSFQILHLLAELLDHGLELKPNVRQLDIVRLRAQRIALAIELLRQEIELAPDRPTGLDEMARLRDVRDEAIELLADTRVGGHQRPPWRQPGGIEAFRAIERCCDLFVEPRLDGV